MYRNKQQIGLGMASAFAMVAHDIKNSLGVLLRNIGLIEDGCQAESCPMRDQCADMEYEVRRINNNLVKMLTLYKVEDGEYMLNVDAHSVADFLDEVMLEHSVILREKRLKYEIVCDPDLYWYFDRNLMTGVIGNALNNALRYTRDCIRLTAQCNDDGLLLVVEDNGEGFAQFMLDQQESACRVESGFVNNNTGLGIYFTQVALDMHRHGEKRGRVNLENGGELGGGRFLILLP
ncbi:MAG: HAMP domain-containing sensor histidine kinase [Candidatus Thiodiazotropha sp.]